MRAIPYARFDGGLRLPGHRMGPDAPPIQTCPLPPLLSVPLLQHAGEPALSCVTVGQVVRRGEPIARAPATLGAAIHAPTSGRVLGIEPRPAPHPSGLPLDCVLIEPDCRDEAVQLAPIPDWPTTPPTLLLDRLHEAGLVGLGGAAFPTDAKLALPRHTLILNGAECEPWIGCDDALLRELAADVIEGARLISHIVGATRCILAIEDDMPQAEAALRAAALPPGFELAVLPARYPQGGERQLIQSLTGHEVPRGGLPRDLGVVVHNVATAASAWRAVALGEPLVERIVTVTGPGVRQPGNFRVRIGTPIAWLVAQAGGYTETAARLLLGGPLMGLALPHDDVPISKGSSCVLVLDADSTRDVEPEMPCIRCGECSRVCPARLLPQQLQAYARVLDVAQLDAHGLFDCIECGACDQVCPSHIPLVDWYRHAKAELRARGTAEAEAQAAKRRFESRNARLEREAAEQAAQRSAKAAAPDAVKAAIERARKKRDSGFGIRDS